MVIYSLFLWDPEENMSDGKKLYPLKNGYSRMNFKIETKDGKVLSAVCKYRFKVEYYDLMWKASFVRIL